MKVGYARVSTQEQKLESQTDALEAAGCEKIYSEKSSGVKASRPQLDKCISYLRKGDTIVVYKLDRIGRNVKNLVELAEKFEKEGIHFISIKDGFDTTTAIGKFFFHMMAAISQFDRDMLSERTSAGLKAARARGRLGGRKPMLNKANIRDANDLYKKGVHVKQIAKMLKCSRPTVYKYLNDDLVGKPIN